MAVRQKPCKNRERRTKCHVGIYKRSGKNIKGQSQRRLWEESHQIKICFLGFTEVNPQVKMDEIKRFRLAENDWLCKESDAYILDHVNNMITHSQKIKMACTAHGLPYFDTSANFLDAIEDAMIYLIKD